MNYEQSKAQNQAVNMGMPDSRPMPNSVIFNTIEGNAKRIAGLRNAIEELSVKMRSVLLPSPVQMMSAASGSGANLPVVESDLTQQLRRQGESIDHLVGMVNDLRDRAEI